MAEKKNTKQTKPAHSGFDAPVYGKVWPKGTTVKQNADGTVTLVPPKKTAKK